MLHAYSSWEKKLSPLEIQIYGEETRIYPCVELPFNVPLFHVTVLPVEDGKPAKIWASLVFADLRHLVAFLLENDFSDVQIGFQPRRCDVESNEHRITPLLEIVVETDCAGDTNFILRCADQEYVEGASHNINRATVERTRIWKSPHGTGRNLRQHKQMRGKSE